MLGRLIAASAVVCALAASAQAQPITSTVSSTVTSTDFHVVVVGKAPPRAASEWTFDLGVERSAPQAGGSGAELLRRAPGFYISQHSGEGKAHQIFVRGFDAVHGQDTAISVGGIPVNEVSNIHAQGYADLHFLIPEATEQLHILEGTYDPRQGDFAVAGSLDFDLGFTERGLFGRVTGGQYGLFRSVVAWGPEGQPDETFVAGEFARGDGFGPSRAWNRASAIGQALFPLGAALDLRILATTYAGRFDSAGVVREDDLESGKVGLYDTYDANQGGASARHSALLEILYHGQNASAALSTFAILRDLRLSQNFTGYIISDEGDRTEQVHEATTFGGAGHYHRSIIDRVFAAEAGLSWRYDRVDQAQRRLRTVDGKPQVLMPSNAGSIDAGQIQDEVDADLRITDLGLYLDLELRLFGALRIKGGVRGEAQSFVIFDRLANEGLGERRDAFGYHVGPKVSLRYTVIPELDLFASYGDGFRSPQALSLAQGEKSTFTDVHSGELGARLDLGDVLSATLAAFTTYVAQDLVFDHVTGRTTVFGPTTRVGGALVVESKPLEWLSATFSATYTRAWQNETKDQVPFVPPLVMRLDAHAEETLGRLWELDWGLFGELGVTFLGPRPLPFSELGDAVFLVEAAVGFALGPGSFSIEVFNLFDSRWHDGEFVYASNFDPSGAPSLVPAHHITAGRPISVQGTLTIHY